MNCGARFSLKANGPSLASSDKKTLDAELGVDLERVVLVQAFGFADGVQDRLHGQRAVVGDHVGDLERFVQRGPVGNDVADDPYDSASAAVMCRPVSSRSAAIV